MIASTPTASPEFVPPDSGRWRDTAVAALIGLLSLLLLVYAGLGEAYRTYPGFVVKSLAEQGQVLENAIDGFLKSGLAVEDFPGLDPMAATLMTTNPLIARVGVDDAQGKQIFQRAALGLPADATERFEPVPMLAKPGRFAVEASDDTYRVRLQLDDGHTARGSLRIDYARANVVKVVGGVFRWVWVAFGALLPIYTLVAFVLSGRPGRGGRALAVTYASSYLAMAVVVVGALVVLYAGAIQAKTEAMGASLAGRLDTAFSQGLDLADFTGLDRTFQSYKQLDPDLGYAILTANGKVLIATEGVTPGSAWRPAAGYFNFDTTVASPGGARRTLSVGVRQGVVYRALWRSVKNFLVLFVASGFVAALFFDFRTVLAQRAMAGGDTAFQLGAVRPIYFLVVFIEGLASSFLPPFFTDLAVASHASPGLVASLFTTYFLAFVAALLPAGQIARSRGPRPLVLAGALLSGTGMAIAGSGVPFMIMYVARAVAGFGQGLVLVGVEAYIMRFARAGQRTQASTIVVYGYNGGMIAGGAIGALLAVYMGPRAVMGVAAGLGLATVLFGLAFVRRDEATGEAEVGPGAGAAVGTALGRCLRDGEFIRTTLLVGIPSKAVLTGVTVFAAPLLLARLGYQREDVGQILMAYAAGVLLSSRQVARLVDRTGGTRRVLVLGILGSGVGLFLLGLVAPVVGGGTRAIVLAGLPLVGLFVLGLAHGCINAPVVTHIGKTEVARELGHPVAGSLYRFLERAGHVSGPLVVGPLLAIGRPGAAGLGWLGAGIVATGLLYVLLGGLAPGSKDGAA